MHQFCHYYGQLALWPLFWENVAAHIKEITILHFSSMMHHLKFVLSSILSFHVDYHFWGVAFK